MVARVGLCRTSQDTHRPKRVNPQTPGAPRGRTSAVAELPQRGICHVKHHLRGAGVALAAGAAPQLLLDAARLLGGRER